MKTFSLCFSKMAESFENLDGILPDWVNEDIEKRLVQAVDKFQKQEEEKARFFVENETMHWASWNSTTEPLVLATEIKLRIAKFTVTGILFGQCDKMDSRAKFTKPS